MKFEHLRKSRENAYCMLSYKIHSVVSLLDVDNRVSVNTLVPIPESRTGIECSDWSDVGENRAMVKSLSVISSLSLFLEIINMKW